MPGKLYICATPIGNLNDVTLRVLDALREADVILAEDTRLTSRLCARYEIQNRLERCDENVIRNRIPEILERIAEGETFAFVSDAGTPAISDPGAPLIEAAIDAGVQIEVLPGANAVLTALVGSGLPTENFYFGGFLPRKIAERRSVLDSLVQLNATLIFYESPHRAASAAATIADIFPDRKIVMARELTKLHEEFLRGYAPEVAYKLSVRPPLKGEVVLLISPPTKGSSEALPSEEEIDSLIESLAEQGLSKSDMVKELVSRCGLSRNAAYSKIHT